MTLHHDNKYRPAQYPDNWIEDVNGYRYLKDDLDRFMEGPRRGTVAKWIDGKLVIVSGGAA